MSNQLTRQGFRLRADERSRQALIDVYTNAAPQGWGAASSQFEVALATRGALADVSNLASVKLEGSPYATKDAARLFSKTVTALDNTLTEDTWKNGAKQHALFTFTDAEMNILANGTDQADVWLVITALTTSGEKIVCGTGKMTFRDDGAPSGAASPPVNPGSAISLGDADARYPQKADLPPTGVFFFDESASPATLDWAASAMAIGSIAGNVTLAFVNATPGTPFTVALSMYSDGVVVTWPGGITWLNGGAIPTPSGDGVTDVYSFICVGAGNYLGIAAKG